MKDFVSETPRDTVARNIFGIGKFYNPITWIKWTATHLFGRKMSYQVLPAQNLANDDDYVRDILQSERFYEDKISKLSHVRQNCMTVVSHDGAELETMELLHSSQESKLLAEQDHIICIQGNGMCFQDTLREMLADCEDMEWNIIGFNFRNVFRSTGESYEQMGMITDVITQIERLKQNGVDISKIKLLGHSTGAAVATLVSYVYNVCGEDVKIFNGRSFTSYSDFKYEQQPTAQDKMLKGNLFRLGLYLTNFELPALKYYKLLSDEVKEYIVIKKSSKVEGCVADGVIPKLASLHAGLKSERRALKQLLTEDGNIDALNELDNRKVFSFNKLYGFGHSDPVCYLECATSREDARTQYRKFFQS